MFEVLTDGGVIVRVQTWDVETTAPTGLEGLLGAAWPREVGAAVDAGALGAVICVGPTEWLVLGTASQPASLVELELALAGTVFRTTDVSQALLRLHIEGNAAVSVLGKGCSLDVDLAAFAVGRATRTRLAGIPAVLWRTGAVAFDCIVTKSHGDYFRAWLDDAALEFRGAA
jgi:sarcosine oxidase subunit gamma